jgi:hypothetical protein
MNKVMVQLACALSLFVVFGCATDSGIEGESIPDSPDTVNVVYLKNNIHVQEQFSRSGKAVYRASYANYIDPGVGHIIIPVNTPVVLKDPGRRRGKEILITTQTDGKDIHFAFNSTHMGMQSDEYVKLITSSNKISLDGLSPIDHKGIAEGKPYVGMTKEGIRVALGYPAVHRTPSLEVSMWVYWTNRFRTIQIEFDPDGNVKQIWY